ncbi:MAG: hypothetical protein OXB86_01555 [Bdellovibrionales bacterium]|nr:hypothetical protein [Bdellovibrionales bacterium]
MKSGLIGLLLFLCIFSEASQSEKISPINLRKMRLAKALVERNAPAFRMELEKLLNFQARVFFEVINSVTESGDDIFVLLGKIFQENFDNEIAETTDITQLRKGASDMIGSLPFTGFELIGLSTPPLYRENKQTRSPATTALIHGNRKVHEVFRKYPVTVIPDLYILQKSSIWRQIFQTKLEDTPLAQAILKEDPQAFYEALKNLYSGSAKDFFSVWHSTTEAGDTLLHLAAKVKSHQEEFAGGIEELLEFATPIHLTEESITISSNDELPELKGKTGGRRWLYGGSMVLLGGASAAGLFYSDHHIFGIGMLALAGEGLRQCYLGFKENRRGPSKE